MSKNLSVADVIEKNKVHSDAPFLICLEVDVKDHLTGAYIETLRLVRNDENITVDGNEFTAFSFDFDFKSEQGSVSEVSIVVRDLTRAIHARMQAYGGGIGFVVRLFVVNGNNVAQPPEDIEYFEVVGSSTQDYTITWRLGAENPLNMRFPRRRQMRDRCGWRYKGVECGYTGALTTCDLSLQGANGCAAHNNTLNYGGFPGIMRSGNYG